MDGLICKACGAMFSGHGKRHFCDACYPEMSRHFQKNQQAKTELAQNRAWANQWRRCELCAGPMPSNTRPDVAWCSLRCKRQKRAAQSRDGWHRRTAHFNHTKPCLICGNVFATRSRSVLLCSDVCRDVREKQIEAEKRAANPGRYREYDRNWRERNREKYLQQAAAQRRKHKEKRLAYQKQWQKRPEVKRRRLIRRWGPAEQIDRTCDQCGVVFKVPPWQSAKTCSPECRTKRRSARAKGKRRQLTEAQRIRQRAYWCLRRAIRKGQVKGGEVIPWTEVADACGWSCQMCGVECLRSLRGTTDDCAPEIDHKVPLARGGRHVRENVQLLCRKCNLRKSDQLPMAG